MDGKTSHKLAFALAIAWMLAACTSSPGEIKSEGPPKADLVFVDLQGFDRDLATSLSAPMPEVNVTFYDRVSPSALPQRLQQWLAAVQTAGGTVKVVPPKSTVTAKSPFLLIGAVSTLWTASKTVNEMSAKAQLQYAHAYDAELLLKQDEMAGVSVDKVVFVQRRK